MYAFWRFTVAGQDFVVAFNRKVGQPQGAPYRCDDALQAGSPAAHQAWQSPVPGPAIAVERTIHQALQPAAARAPRARTRSTGD